MGVSATGFQWEKSWILLNILHYLRQTPLQSYPASVPRLRNPGVKWDLILFSIWKSWWVTEHLPIYLSAICICSSINYPFAHFAHFYFSCLPLLSSHRNTLYFINPLFVFFIENIIFQKYLYWLVYNIFCQRVRSYWRT